MSVSIFSCSAFAAHGDDQRCTAFVSFVPLLALFLGLVLSPLAASASSNSQLSKGRASWYGTSAHGKKTANGEIYNREAMTAAHKSIPFGTVLRVFNLKNGRYVLVRVNDRGPFVEGREVDLSLRAAEALRMIRSGVASVAIQVVSDKKGRALNPENAFYVHLTSDEDFFSSRVLAADMAGRLRMPVRSMRLVRGAYQGYAVLAGPFERFRDAQKAFLKLEEKGFAALGVVEGPISGGALPVFDLPGRRKGGKDAAVTTGLASTLNRTVASFADLVRPVLAPDTGALIFSIAKNIFPAHAGGAMLLSPQPATPDAYLSQAQSESGSRPSPRL